jgi:hypothetical protein
MRKPESLGAIALSTLLGITLIVSVFATALAVLSFFEGWIGFGATRSNEAYFVSQSGVYDALWRIIRDKNFTTSPSGYTLTVGSGTATVVVEVPATPPQHRRIRSTGDVQGRKRKLEVLVYVDDLSGEVRIVEWRESAL